MIEHKLAGSNTNIIEQFAFDPAGNRVSAHSSRVDEANKQTQTATRKPQGHPTEIISQGKHVRYTYDNDGRVVHKTIAANALQSSNSLIGFKKELAFKYNANNELSQTILTHHKGSDTTVTTTDYYYDAFGRRIHKHSQTSKGSSTQDKHMHMLWDGDNAIQEHTDTHVYNTIYDQGSFTPVARMVWRKDTLQQAANDGSITNDNIVNEQDSSSIQVYHYHNDQLGTPNELTNEKGEVVWLADYEAWGAPHKEMCWGHSLASQDESHARVEGKEVWHDQKLNPLQIEKEHLQPIRFQGQYFDVETGLHYNRFRYYDPDMGMLTTRDPIGLYGGLNVFAYAPNPIGWVDPLGLQRDVLDEAYNKNPWGNKYGTIFDGIDKNIPKDRPKYSGKGPFGGVCGAEGSTLATWIPDGYWWFYEKACQEHDECYSKCGNTKSFCDIQFLKRGAVLYAGAVMVSKDSTEAYDNAQQKAGCCSECTKVK